MIIRSHNLLLSGSALIIAIFTQISSAYAQASKVSDDTSLGEIVVTAQKRQQNLQDVGVSIVALSANDLKRFGVTDSKDIAKLVAGISLDATASGGVNAQLTVRGVSQSDYSAIQESPNSIYIDDVYLSSSNAAAFSLYDLERVEILRGPQGTLFGRASSGGLANFITAKPSSTWQGYFEIGYGSFNDAYAEGAIGGPLSDRIRFRISSRAETSDGWWRNYNPGGKNAFRKNFVGVRGQIEADISDTILARLTISYDKNPRHFEGIYRSENYYINNGQPVALPANVDAYGTGAGNDFAGYRNPYKRAQSGSFNNIGFLKNERFSPTLNIAWNIGDATVTSISNYSKFSFSYNEDCDGGPIDYCQFPFAQRLKQYSEELRLNGKTGSVTYTGGFYYLSVNQKSPIDFVFPALSGTDFAFSDSNFVHQRLESYAVFGQLEYALTDKLSATFGARYTHDHKVVDSKVYFYELGNGYSGGIGSVLYDPALVAYDFSRATVGDLAVKNDNLWSGKAQIDYKPNRETIIYASVSRGVKGSGFNTNVSGNLSVEGTPFKSEFLYAYEAGAKLQFFDRRVRINLSAFDYDYHRFQGFAFTGLQGVVGNYDGYFRGGELELAATPARGLNITLGAAYLRSKLKNVPTAYDGVRDEQGVGAPRWNLNGMVSKEFEIGENRLSLQWSGNYIGDRYASIDNNAATFVEGSFVHNARMSFHLSRLDVDISVFVNNISNTARETYAFDLIASTGSVIKSYDKPRWFGGSIRKTF